MAKLLERFGQGKIVWIQGSELRLLANWQACMHWVTTGKEGVGSTMHSREMHHGMQTVKMHNVLSMVMSIYS